MKIAIPPITAWLPEPLIEHDVACARRVHAGATPRPSDHRHFARRLNGQEFVVAYAASKFELEGWMESLRFDVAPFGIDTMVVEPSFFSG